MELDYSRLDPELAPALELLPPEFGNITRDNVISVREASALQRTTPPQTDVTVEQRTIPGTDVDVGVYIYRPSTNVQGPGVLWIHGGGYILGSAEDDRARRIAETLNCTVASVDYRLAPEHPFPAGPEDCYSALHWLMANASELNIDPTRVAIGGASAGGGMAAGLALMNRDRGGPTLAFQLLLYPMIDNLHATPSGQYTNHPIWNQQTSFNAWEMYLNGTPGAQASPYAAATRADDLANLPPAYICVGSEDLFRDEDIAYAQRLIAAGIACELAVFPGLYHGGDMFVPKSRISKRLHDHFLGALAHALSANT